MRFEASVHAPTEGGLFRDIRIYGEEVSRRAATGQPPQGGPRPVEPPQTRPWWEYLGPGRSGATHYETPPIPRTPDGGLDFSRLVPGEQHTTAQGQVLTYLGREGEQPRQTSPINVPPSKPIPLTAQGYIDFAKLKIGARYEKPDGSIVIYTGVPPHYFAAP
jgi:hypothetical protein